jgi:predicted HAD superfamily Cof-like phosphohydrolase
MRRQINHVKDFHRAFGHPVRQNPTTDVPDEQKALRVKLLREEVEELEEALRNNDLVETADALTDIMYVLAGAYLTFGLQDHAEALFEEVQSSNMSKLGEDGKPIHREDGKIMKGPNFRLPDIKKILGA